MLVMECQILLKVMGWKKHPGAKPALLLTDISVILLRASLILFVRLGLDISKPGLSCLQAHGYLDVNWKVHNTVVLPVLKKQVE